MVNRARARNVGSSKETGLIGGVEKRTIEIVSYDATWVDKYQKHATQISAAVGGVALRIEHIGSTAVPGLAAKAVIDILLVVRNSADEDVYLLNLQTAGYELRVREPDFHEHRMLRTPERDVHIHVLSDGCPEIQRYLTFRDRLRRSANARRLYEETKRRLAEQPWPDMNAYADAKSDVIERIITGARAEFGTFD